MSRSILLVCLALFPSLSAASDAAAQRKGFIIGFGAGAGVTTGDVSTRIAASTDFKIGAMVGKSVQLYYTSKQNFQSSGGSLIVSGLAGLGVTYEMASGFNINGTAGFADWTILESGTDAGFGLGLGFGYEIADLWVLNLGGTLSLIGDATVINIAATISILSH